MAATSAYEAALAEYRAAATAIVQKLKSGERLTRAHWESEKTARAELLKTRDLVARLDRIRKLSEGI